MNERRVWDKTEAIGRLKKREDGAVLAANHTRPIFSLALHRNPSVRYPGVSTAKRTK